MTKRVRAGRDALRDRLARLEREMLFLRRELGVTAESLPRDTFAALQVRVGDAWYLVALEALAEIVAVPACERSLDAPPWIVGTFRYGVALVPVVNLRHRLHDEALPVALTDLVLIAHGEPPKGFLAQDVGDVVWVDPGAVAPPPPGIPQTPYLLGALPEPQGPTYHLLVLDRLGRDGVL